MGWNISDSENYCSLTLSGPQKLTLLTPPASMAAAVNKR